MCSIICSASEAWWIEDKNTRKFIKRWKFILNFAINKKKIAVEDGTSSHEETHSINESYDTRKNTYDKSGSI